MPAVTTVSRRLTTQMRKYSAPLPVKTSRAVVMDGSAAPSGAGGAGKLATAKSVGGRRGDFKTLLVYTSARPRSRRGLYQCRRSWIMATYVLVHGAYQGGWIWKPVIERLRAAGH